MLLNGDNSGAHFDLRPRVVPEEEAGAPLELPLGAQPPVAVDGARVERHVGRQPGGQAGPGHDHAAGDHGHRVHQGRGQEPGDVSGVLL